ncbi:helix-turn-helix transcriptional regulator [Thermaurantiacus sp.]
MIPFADQIGPIRALLRAPREAAPFSAFLAGLAAAVRGTALLALERDRVWQAATAGSPPARPVREFIFSELPRRDRFPRRRLRDGRVYAPDELLDPIDPADRAWREAFARADLRVVRSGTPAGATVLLALVRTGRPFAAVDAARLSELAPLVAEAADAVLAAEAERLDAAAGALALDRLGLSWTLFDADGRVRAGAHVVVSRSLAESLRAGQDTIVKGGDGKPLLLVPLPEGGGMLAFQATEGEEPLAPIEPGVLGRLFGLALAEARFAAHLAAGIGIAEAGRRLGWRLETARHYSKRLYQKTGTRGEAAWVARARGGVLALAPRAAAAPAGSGRPARGSGRRPRGRSATP